MSNLATETKSRSVQRIQEPTWTAVRDRIVKYGQPKEPMHIGRTRKAPVMPTYFHTPGERYGWVGSSLENNAHYLNHTLSMPIEVFNHVKEINSRYEFKGGFFLVDEVPALTTKELARADDPQFLFDLVAAQPTASEVATGRLDAVGGVGHGIFSSIGLATRGIAASISAVASVLADPVLIGLVPSDQGGFDSYVIAVWGGAVS